MTCLGLPMQVTGSSHDMTVDEYQNTLILFLYHGNHRGVLRSVAPLIPLQDLSIVRIISSQVTYSDPMDSLTKYNNEVIPKQNNRSRCQYTIPKH